MDSLPTELLLRILQFAVPLNYDPDRYEERLALLRDCCLVSYRWCALAQPMLSEVVDLRSEEDWAALEQKGSSSFEGSRTRIAVICEDEGDEVARLVALAPNIDDLRSISTLSFDFAELIDLKSLRRLVIDGASFPLDLATSPLPSLVELSISGAHFDTRSFEVWLDNRQLPGLRALTISVDFPPQQEQPFPTVSLPFLRQLEVFGITGRLPPSYNSPEYHELTRRRVLGDADLNTSYPLLSVKSRHLPLFPASVRLFTTAEVEEVTLEFGLASLRALVDLEEHLGALLQRLVRLPHPSPLQYLLLPSYLAPESLQLAEIRTVVTDILGVCASDGIEVEFEAYQAWDSEPDVSLSFWRRSKRLKREEEAV